MTQDIVDALRQSSERIKTIVGQPNLLDEAADEIAKLRSERDEYIAKALNAMLRTANLRDDLAAALLIAGKNQDQNNGGEPEVRSEP